ncbi:MAG: hypothetical protein AB7F86_10655 [Bdellovibrionales bacterium]
MRNAPFFLASALLIGQFFNKVFTLGPESDFFAAFRYEGLLFFKNFMAGPDWRFLFIRDWSTSPSSIEHPLLYFRNLDVLHFLAGAVQYLLPKVGPWALVVAALLVSLGAAFLVWHELSDLLDRRVASVALASMLIVPQGLLAASLNLFLAVCLLSFSVMTVLSVRLLQGRPISRGWMGALFVVGVINAGLETNLAVYFAAVVGFCCLVRWLRRGRSGFGEFWKLTIILALPILMVRGVQYGAVVHYGYSELMKEDLQYSRMARISGNVDPVDAVQFFQKRGLNFFGMSERLSLSDLLEETNGVLKRNFGKTLPWIFLLVAILTIRFRKRWDPSIIVPLYLFWMVSLVLFLMVPVTGNALLNLGLRDHAFIDFLLGARLCFYVSVFLVIQAAMELYWPKGRGVIPFVVVALVMVQFRSAQSHNRKENFDFVELLAKVPAGADLVTNFEPSISAVTTGARVNLSWFIEANESCKGLDGQGLLKMYRVGSSESALSSPLYYYLVLTPPYLPEVENPLQYALEKNCLNESNSVVVARTDKAFLIRRAGVEK